MKWSIGALFAVRILLAWVCLSVLPLPRIDVAEKYWAKYGALILSNLGEAEYKHSPASEFPHRVRVVFPPEFKNTHSPLHLFYTPRCCYFHVILACMVLAYKRNTWQRTLVLGFFIANFANMLRLTTSSALRFQDFPSWASHDIPNYIFGASALYLSYLAGRWRFVERFSIRANR